MFFVSRFQHRLAISPTSLHTVAVIVVVAWVIAGSASPITNDSHLGLWPALPDAVTHSGWLNQLLAILTTILSVYTIRELNISHVLLRINSRSISFTLAALMTACVFLHAFQLGYIVMFFIMLSLFFLFSTYHQDNSAGNTYITFLCASISALFYPKLIWMAPLYIFSLYLFRALNPRSISGAILGLLTPFWIVGSITYCIDKMEFFSHLLRQMISFQWSGYTLHSTSQTIMIWLSFAIFLVGTIDFIMRNYLDKTRVRTLYYVIILHGAGYYLLLLLQPVSSLTLLPVTLVFTSIIGGHYISNDDTPLSNILVCIFTVLLFVSYILNAWIL